MNFKKLSMICLISVASSIAFAEQAQVGDVFVLKQELTMAKVNGLRVPEVNVRNGKVIANDTSSAFQCSLAPNGAQFESKFGDVKQYSSIKISPKVFEVVGVHEQGNLGAILSLESASGGLYTLICSRYTGPTSVEFSADKETINSNCGSLCSIQKADSEIQLNGSVQGTFRKSLEL